MTTDCAYRGDGTLLAARPFRGEWLVLVETGGAVTPYCVAAYGSGDDQRGSGSYYETVAQAAKDWGTR